MDLFAGLTLLRKTGNEIDEVSADEALKDVPVVGLYFSAHWCPPCRLFTPTLAEFYASIKAKEQNFEMIFITSDRSDEAMKSYMLECHGDWLAVPYKLEEFREKLDEKFEIDGIPTLIILKDGEMVTNTGRWDVELKPDACYDHWAKGEVAVTETEVDKFLEREDDDDDEGFT
uniref:Thioredoxin domain-containing protein n=1 Tax=Strigamia maritima TaxID=126957 RepID=T1JL93_STRMM